MSPAAPGARTGNIPTKLPVLLLQLNEIFHIVRNWLENHSCDAMHADCEEYFSHQLTDRSAHTLHGSCVSWRGDRG